MTIREICPTIDPVINSHKVDNVIRIYRTELDGNFQYRMHVRRRDAMFCKSHPYDILLDNPRDVLHYIRYIIHPEYGLHISMYMFPEPDMEIHKLHFLEQSKEFEKYETESYEIVGFSTCAYNRTVKTRILNGLRIISTATPV
jgi:hypothetical protein